jgi:hypothetical protein
MPTVTSKNREEFIEKEMAKKSGKSGDKVKFNYPHYKKGDIVRTETGHMMVIEHDKKGEGYIGHAVHPHGETYEPKRQMAVLHKDVGTGKHHLYAAKGDYPKKDE